MDEEFRRLYVSVWVCVCVCMYLRTDVRTYLDRRITHTDAMHSASFLSWVYLACRWRCSIDKRWDLAASLVTVTTPRYHPFSRDHPIGRRKKKKKKKQDERQPRRSDRAEAANYYTNATHQLHQCSHSFMHQMCFIQLVIVEIARKCFFNIYFSPDIKISQFLSFLGHFNIEKLSHN